jgi:flavin reductase (DIM6/NTAB) family NADH-FMN oxidoreductase RutF
MGADGSPGVAAFQQIAATIDYPMWIVTAADGRERSGCLVGFATQCSIDPVRFGAWISKANHTFPIASRTEVLVVHALDEDDMALAQFDSGDHVGHLLAPFAGEARERPGPRLGFQRARVIDPGHEAD